MTSNENPSVANSEFSNCLIIKATLGDETRKVPIVNDEITFDELLIMMQRIFKGQLHASDNVTIKYKDEDDDLITIKDTSDLSFAVACNRVLKLTLFMNEKEEKVFSSADVRAIRDQLKKMRDFSNYMLDRIGDESTDFLPNGDIEQAEIDKSKESVSVPPTLVNKVQHLTSSFKDVNLNQSCEFDPLHEKKVHRDSMEQHYEYETDGKRELVRAETPNSIDSSRSASQKPVDVAQPHVAQQQHIPQAQLQPQSDNVAMIQPSLHQQVNAPPLAQPSAVNGPAVGPPATMQPYGAGSMGGAAVAPPPFSMATSTYQQGYPPAATTTMAPPAAAASFSMTRPATSSTPVPPQQQFAVAAPLQQSTPAAAYQMQQPTVASIYPQQHYGQQQQAFAPPPTAMQQPTATYQQQQPTATYQQQPSQPTSMPTATVGYAAPQQPMSYAAASYQQMPPAAAAPPPMAVGPPPIGGNVMQPGANPFARVSQSPYVRPTAFSGGAQY